VLFTDFQKLIDAQLQSLETFFIALGEMLADQINSDVYPEDFKKWRPNRAPNFHQLVGGQPYFVRCGLNELVNKNLKLDAFLSTATRDNGTYGDHLRRIVRLIHDDEQLYQAMRCILRDQPCPDYDSFCRLRSAGILRGESKENVSLRCKIYEHYLKKHLL